MDARHFPDTAVAMSDRDREILSSLRRVYDAWDRGDFDKMMEIAHPEIEYVGPGGQSALKGAAAVRAWLEPEALEDQRVQPFEFRVNGNRVLVRQQNRARGAGSGIEIDVETWAVWTLNDDGLVTRAEGFLIQEKSEALEAAGLSE
jgi:ketosteroid isomerase-like protein